MDGSAKHFYSPFIFSKVKKCKMFYLSVCLFVCLLQSPQQYLRHHEHVVLDPAFSPSEPSEIFHSDVTENGKRRASDRYSTI